MMDVQIPNYPLSPWERARVRVDKPSIQKCWNTSLFCLHIWPSICGGPLDSWTSHQPSGRFCGGPPLYSANTLYHIGCSGACRLHHGIRRNRSIRLHYRNTRWGLLKRVWASCNLDNRRTVRKEAFRLDIGTEHSLIRHLRPSGVYPAVVGVRNIWWVVNFRSAGGDRVGCRVRYPQCSSPTLTGRTHIGSRPTS